MPKHPSRKLLLLLVLPPIIVFSCILYLKSLPHTSVLTPQHYTHTCKPTSYLLFCCGLIDHLFLCILCSESCHVASQTFKLFLFLFICLCCSICRLENEVFLAVECLWWLPPLLLQLHPAGCSGHLDAAGLLNVCGDVGFPGHHVRSHAGAPTAAAKLPQSYHQRHEVHHTLSFSQTFH